MRPPACSTSPKEGLGLRVSLRCAWMCAQEMTPQMRGSHCPQSAGNLSRNLLLLSGLVASRVGPISNQPRTFYLELIRPLGSFAATQTGKSFGTHCPFRTKLAVVNTAQWFADQPSDGARCALLLALLELTRTGFVLLNQAHEVNADPNQGWAGNPRRCPS